MSWAKIIAGYTIGAYVLDVLVRPRIIGWRARRLACLTGKPMINVGAGMPWSSLASLLLGPNLIGDVNVDIAAPLETPHGPGTVSYGDACRLPFPDKTFGVAFSSHLLEHVENPWMAMKEMERVADHVVAVTPCLLAPHAWIHPGHRWAISSDKIVPLYD